MDLIIAADQEGSGIFRTFLKWQNKQIHICSKWSQLKAAPASEWRFQGRGVKVVCPLSNPKTPFSQYLSNALFKSIKVVGPFGRRARWAPAPPLRSVGDLPEPIDMRRGRPPGGF